MNLRFLEGPDESTILFEISLWVEWMEKPKPQRFSQLIKSLYLKISNYA
jgi:hypothetical protein